LIKAKFSFVLIFENKKSAQGDFIFQYNQTLKFNRALKLLVKTRMQNYKNHSLKRIILVKLKRN